MAWTRSPGALAVGVVVAAAAGRPSAWKAAAPGRLEVEDLMVKVSW